MFKPTKKFNRLHFIELEFINTYIAVVLFIYIKISDVIPDLGHALSKVIHYIAFDSNITVFH